MVEGTQSKQRQMPSVKMSAISIFSVYLPKLNIVQNNIVVLSLLDMGLEVR